LEEVSGTHKKIIDLLAEGKNKEALEFYTDDCVIMPPGREALQGKDGKNNSLRSFSNDFLFETKQYFLPPKFAYLYKPWLRNNVSWFGCLQGTWLGNNVSWFVHLQETWLGNNVSWFVHLQETWLENNVSWFVHLQETWLGNNVSWFVHLQETWLRNDVSWFVHL
jgi:hypothetical protein